jgi:cell division protein FtsB
MSRGTRGSRENGKASTRPVPSRDARSTHGLRVIEGGRGEDRAVASERKRAPARSCELPRKVKRRRRIAAAILVILAAGLITYILLGPVTRVIESRRNLSSTEAQLAEEKSRTQALEERKAWDMTERFLEWEARKIGYVKPGEIPIVVLDYQAEEPAPEETNDNPSP